MSFPGIIFVQRRFSERTFGPGPRTKVRRNMQRTWPDWRTAEPDKAIEHVRT